MSHGSHGQNIVWWWISIYSDEKMIIYDYISGWWYTYPTPLKNDGLKVSWDDYSIPNMMGKS